MALSNTSKTVATLAVLGLGLAVYRAQNHVADCTVNIPSTSRAVFPFCKGETPGATPHCYVWPMRVGPQALYRLGRPSADAGVPYEYGIGFETLSQSEVNNAAALAAQIITKLDLDDAENVPDPSTVMETTCPATPPRGAVVMPGDPLFQSACACASDATCLWSPDGIAPIATVAPKNLTLGPGRWSGSGCVPKACVEMAGFPSMPGVCL